MAAGASSALAIDLASRAARQAAAVPMRRGRAAEPVSWISDAVEFRAPDARYPDRSPWLGRSCVAICSDGGSMMSSFPMFNDEIAAPALRTGAHIFGSRAAYAAAR